MYTPILILYIMYSPILYTMRLSMYMYRGVYIVYSIIHNTQYIVHYALLTNVHAYRICKLHTQ